MQRYVKQLSYQLLLFCIALSTNLFAAPDTKPIPAEDRYKQSYPKIYVTEKEHQWLQEHPVIRIGIDKDYAPFEWINQNGDYVGFAADYIQSIGRRLGLKIEIVQKDSWYDVLDLAQQGGIDMLSIAVSTKERAKFLTFTQPYITSSAVIINRVSQGYIGDLSNLNNKSVAIQKGRYTQELLSKDYPDISVISTPNLITALKMVSEGKADAYVGEVLTANYVMQKAGLANLRFAGQTLYKSNFRFAINKAHPELETLISKVLISMDQAEKNTIFNRWHSLKTDTGVSSETLTNYAIGMFFILLIIALWIYRLRNELRQRRTTEKSLQLAATVYQNSSEAMMVMDKNNIVIAVNPAFIKMTGFTLDEVISKNATLLKSELQETDFYEAMWQSILDTGHWQGELRSKHKSGDDCVQWLSINTIFDDDLKVYQRVALFSDITERKNAEQLIHIQANYDALTKLPNRLMFIDRLEQEIKKSNRNLQPFALLFLDLDNFKDVNDTFGHHVGDELLVQTAERIIKCVRESDTVARLGGDEYTVILPEMGDLLSLERIVQNILTSLSKPFDLEQYQSYISASIGITLYPTDADSLDELLKNADMAMYRAKDLGRNRFSYFTASMQEAAQQHQELLSDLRTAVCENQFELYYQPIIDLKTEKVIQAEALIRWNHPTRGVIHPDDFIYLAEESALIIEIGNWAFYEAVCQLKLWQLSLNSKLKVSINKSSVQFRANNIHSDWIAHLKTLDLPKGTFIIEIKESLLMDNESNIQQHLLDFRDAGIQVAIDDFGTGHSSISYMNKFHIDYLKIDQSFVKNVALHSMDLALSEAIIVMAHKLGLKVIAEGIETEVQKNLLMEAGCDLGQGFLYSKPVSVEQFEVLYKTPFESLPSK